ncbi:MAG: PPC domain-containing protein [Cyanobacteria bacterium P01_D01_bin.36]
MKFMTGKFSNKVTRGLVAAAALTGVAGIAHQAALAQALLQQEGTLAPMEDAYSFDGDAGQTMTIELQSEDFDPILLLKGPDGEVLTSNDDYGGTLNSTIVIELPEAGTYNAVASSFSGQGGNYQIEIRPASEYEQVFSRAYNFNLSEDYGDSIEAYTAAIELNDTDPSAYFGRADARISQVYLEATEEIATPNDLPQDVVDAVVADYLKAADLLEQQGQAGPAASLREQADYFSGSAGAGVTPDVPVDEPVDESIDEPVDAIETPMPVEPDGGIGDGATPVPDAE